MQHHLRELKGYSGSDDENNGEENHSKQISQKPRLIHDDLKGRVQTGARAPGTMPVCTRAPCPGTGSTAVRPAQQVYWFNGGKLPGNLKHCFKKSKDKAVFGKRSFKR